MHNSIKLQDCHQRIWGRGEHLPSAGFRETGDCFRLVASGELPDLLSYRKLESIGGTSVRLGFFHLEPV